MQVGAVRHVGGKAKDGKGECGTYGKSQSLSQRILFFFFLTVSADTARRGVTSKRTGACASRTTLAAAFGTLQQMLINPRTHDGDDTSWSTCCLVGDLVAEVVPFSLTQALLSMLAVPSCGAGAWRPQSQTCYGVASALARMQECAAGVAWRWV